MSVKPVHLDLEKRRGLTVEWQDGVKSFYPIAYLRRMSPSAEARALRESMERNPLTVLPSTPAGQEGPLTAVDAEMIGHYAVRIRFSDGHETGIFTWSYLRSIDPGPARGDTDAAGLEASGPGIGTGGGTEDGDHPA